MSMDKEREGTIPTLKTSKLEECQPDSSIIGNGTVVLGDVVFNSWRWDFRSYAKVKTHRMYYDVNFLSCLTEEICYGPMYGAVVSVMEYFYARLKNPIEADNILSPASMRNYLYTFRYLLKWMNDCSIYSFEELRHDDLNKLVMQLRVNCINEDISSDQAGKVIGLVKKYYEYNKRVSDPIVFNPFGGKGASELGLVEYSSNSAVENKTPPIPKEVMTPLLRYSLDMINHYSDDILQARECINNTKEKVLSDIRSAGKTVSYDSTKTRISTAVASKLQTLPICDDPNTGRPWRDPWERFSDWSRSESALMNACMTVVFFLSGMRESEVVALEAGCAYTDISSDGVVEEYFVRSRLLKRHNKQEQWVIIKPAYDALLLAEKISRPLRNLTGCDRLFPRKQNGANSYIGKLSCNDSTDSTNTADFESDDYELGTGTINYRLNNYVEYLNNTFGESGDVIPKVDGKRWGIATSQFRRTLARFIARQPFGIIAGMIQYKHVNTSMFEGYAGNDSNWKQMLEEEKTLASIDHLRDLYFDIQDGTVAGAKGERLVEECEQVMADFKGVAGDRRSDGLSYWLESTRANFHVGNLNYCFFNPDYAMCNKNSEIEQRRRPALNRCHPDKCPNSCVSKVHAPIWQAQYSDADDLLQTSTLSEPQRISLEYDREVAKKLLEKIAIESV